MPARLAASIRNVGPIGTLVYLMQRLRSAIAPVRLYRLTSRYAAHPVWCRQGTSDLNVFGQIFIAREYRCLDDATNPALIIDCGANAGFSAAYFLSKFKNAHVICLEPDEGNFQALVRNVAPFGDRVTKLKKGIWSKTTGLIVERGRFRDGREWSFTVKEVSPGERAEIEGIDIASVLRATGYDRISVLKIDIEGAEREIFAGDCAWLSLVENLVIELHGQDSERIFFEAIAPFGFEISSCDELTVCKRAALAA